MRRRKKYNTDEMLGILRYWKLRLKDHGEWDESENMRDDYAMNQISARLIESAPDVGVDDKRRVIIRLVKERDGAE